MSMKLSEFYLAERQGRRVPSPGRCIYCGAVGVPLTDEHVIPFALGANSLVLEKSSCKVCQVIIHGYEQEVLKKQLGTFRAQVDAPTRNKKDRLKEVRLHFMEVHPADGIVRDLGSRMVPLGDAPLAISLWSSPPPQLFVQPGAATISVGKPWIYVDREALSHIVKRVSGETGAVNIAVKIGEVNRVHYLRCLAKMAHAYAAAEMGLDAFDPLLIDLILCRRDDVENFVGDFSDEGPFARDDAHTLQVSVGEPTEGPYVGYLIARIVLYPSLGSPAHAVILGKARM